MRLLGVLWGLRARGVFGIRDRKLGGLGLEALKRLSIPRTLTRLQS